MGKAFTPTVASGNTSSAVKQLPSPNINNSGLSSSSKAGLSHVSGPQRTGTASQPRSFAQPTHSYGNSTIAVSHEQRSGGVPHMPMLPGIQKLPKV